MYSWTLITGDAPHTPDGRRLRAALGAFPTGVCLVTTLGDGGKREGMTVNSFASVSLSPPLILWSVRDDANSAAAFLASRHFILSILTVDQKELASHFARATEDKFAKYASDFTTGIGMCPKLLNSEATFECTVYSSHQEGDHTILVGRVEHFSHTSSAPLAFLAGKMGSLSELAQ